MYFYQVKATSFHKTHTIKRKILIMFFGGGGFITLNRYNDHAKIIFFSRFFCMYVAHQLLDTIFEKLWKYLVFAHKKVCQAWYVFLLLWTFYFNGKRKKPQISSHRNLRLYVTFRILVTISYIYIFVVRNLLKLIS